MALIILPRLGGFHAIVEDLDRDAVDRFEGLHMTAQQGLEILVHDTACKQEARKPQHQAEQPDDPADAGFIGKIDDEPGEVDLRLHTRRRLEPHLEGLGEGATK